MDATHRFHQGYCRWSFRRGKKKEAKRKQSCHRASDNHDEQLLTRAGTMLYPQGAFLSENRCIVLASVNSSFSVQTIKQSVLASDTAAARIYVIYTDQNRSTVPCPFSKSMKYTCLETRVLYHTKEFGIWLLTLLNKSRSGSLV